MLAVPMEAANPMGLQKAQMDQTEMEILLLWVPHELSISTINHPLGQE